MKPAKAALLTTLFGVLTPVWASSFTSSATIDIVSSAVFTSGSDCDIQSAGSATCTAGFGHLGSGAGSGYGQAFIDSEGLHAYSSVSIGGGDHGSSGQTSSSIHFSDSFLFQHADGTGFDGSVTLGGELDGTTSSPDWHNGSTTAELWLAAGGANGTQICFATTTSLLPTSYSLPCQIAVAFSAGQPFSLSGFLSVTADGYSDLNGVASGDFSHTAKIPSIVVRDSNGVVVTDAVMKTDSGFNYGSVTPAPEPGALNLGLGGLTMLVFSFRRRNRQAD